jgi:hypothetical protein
LKEAVNTTERRNSHSQVRAMVRVPRSGSQQAPPLLERIARAICEEYRGDPNAEFAGLPMWHQFLPDAHALLPVVVSIANDISQSAGKPLLTECRKTSADKEAAGEVGG